ncbi:MAG: flagellar basal body-associated FliL family protein [Planctomycetota bacterium]
MADEATESQGGGEEKKKSPMMTMIIVGVVMVIEAVVVAGLVMFSGMGPSSASAKDIEGIEQADREKMVEIKLVESKFPNNTRGTTWLWDTEVYLQVRQKNEERITGVLEDRKAEIHSGIRLIFSQIHDSQLQEPGSQTITRQLAAFVNEVFGEDADGNPRIERVLLTKLAGFPADF